MNVNSNLKKKKKNFFTAVKINSSILDASDQWELVVQLPLHDAKYGITLKPAGPSRGKRNHHGNVNGNDINIHKPMRQSQRMSDDIDIVKKKKKKKYKSS